MLCKSQIKKLDSYILFPMPQRYLICIKQGDKGKSTLFLSKETDFVTVITSASQGLELCFVLLFGNPEC